MRHQIPVSIALAGALAACGVPQEEHDKALAAQKAALNAEMQKAQEACEADKAEMKARHEEILASKGQMIEGLEAEVEKMGGDLESVRTELGERVTQLASTETELEQKQKQLQATEKEVAQLRALREQAEREAAQFKALATRLKSMIDAGKLEVVMRDGRINLKLPDDVLFPSGQRRLKKEGKKALEEVAQVLKDVEDRDFLIAGHTDNVPVSRRSRFENNWELSTARAVTVVELLIDAGVQPERLAAAGFGEHDPIANNETKEGRAQNRRLEIILLPKLEQVEL